LSANFTDRPACVINFLGLGCTIEDKTWLSGAISKHLSLNDEYHQMCDMTALPSVMKQCVSGLRGRQPITFMYNVQKKLKTQRDYDRFLRRHDRIINHRITDQKRHRHDLSTRQNNGVDIHPKHRNISSVDITHFLLIETSQATATVTVAPVQLEKMPSNSGQQTKFTQDGYVYWGVTNESNTL
jgi:hypothetical protein